MCSQQGSKKKPVDASFQRFVSNVRDYAIFLLDTEGRVTSWNTGAERIKGYKSAEIVGRHFSVFYPEEDVRANKPQRLLNEAAANGTVEDEGWRLRRGGTKFWADVVLTYCLGLRLGWQT